MANYMDYPFQVNARGRTGLTGRNDHVRDMIEQVLFTSPGERVNRPDFGCGLLQMVFGLTSDALISTVRYSVHGALQRWLGDIIEVQDVTVRQDDSRLSVQVVYVRLDSGEILTDNFETG
jgi:phage baseplate assembly protein W